MAPSPLAWLLRLAAFFHLCTLLPAFLLNSLSQTHSAEHRGICSADTHTLPREVSTSA
uniref:C-X3-C motif chemokine ligand 1 n=1 Tax=Mus musculus TaxID=10090 RepID=D6RCV0_MOUSE